VAKYVAWRRRRRYGSSRNQQVDEKGRFT
jgi:hypothetical protein